MDEVKVGIELRKVTDEFVTKERIGEAVRFFMRDRASVSNNVRKLQTLAMEAVSEGGSVEQNLEDFIAELGFGKHAQCKSVRRCGSFN